VSSLVGEDESVAPAPPVDAQTEEVRVAMALNGGVSLAVWMGGCICEFDCARRAHLAEPAAPVSLPATPAGPAPALPPAGCAAIYSALCHAFSRELVVDIMSGSSAGGINGAMLAGVVARGLTIDVDFLRTRWIELGDFSELLQRLNAPSPTSLLRGDYFYKELLKVFEGLLTADEDGGGTALKGVDRIVPVLNVTTTDLVGTERAYEDTWGETLIAREYRACFRFRKLEDFTPENLAAASRASASFPIAFAPAEVKSEGPGRLAGFSTSRWVVDGGLLDNAPIRLALDAIPQQRAKRQVKRFLCYLNPEPPGPIRQDDRTEPDLRRVVGAVVNLPRQAPFVDELSAVQRATSEWVLNEHAEIPLLGMDLGCLESVAGALLPAYRRRRRRESLVDLDVQPATATAVFDGLEDSSPRDGGASRAGGNAPVELPWIPDRFCVPNPGEWRWGILAALRIEQLALDLVGWQINNAAVISDDDGTLPPTATTVVKERTPLLAARAEMQERAEILRSRYERFLSDVCVKSRLEAMAVSQPRSVEFNRELDALAAYTWSREAEIYELVHDTATTMFGLAGQLGPRDGVDVGRALFGEERGSGTLTEDALAHFLRRTLAIEVVRRAFSAKTNVDPAQPIEFAQLTPYAPTPLLDEQPFTHPRTLAPSDKVTGLELGHFGGFYRRSWRANDFMWGRMDSALRVVALLIDTDRASEGSAAQITQAVIAATQGHEWLLEQALDDAAAAGLADSPAAENTLLQRLEDAIAADLQREGQLTRTLCGLAAQLQILKVELPILVREVAVDEQAGAALNKLDLPPVEELEEPAGLVQAIHSLRGGDPITKRLGVGVDAETTSDLAVRTMSKAGLVALSLVRTTNSPFSSPLQAFRGALLPLSGAIARSAYDRAGVLFAFWAASLFLAVRFVTTGALEPPDLGRISVWALAVTLIGLLIVSGTFAVPLFRTVRGRAGAKPLQALWVLGLAATGAGAVIVLAVWPGKLSLAQLIVQRGAKHAPKAMLVLPLFIVLGVAPVNSLLRSTTRRVTSAAWSRSLLVIALVSGVWTVTWGILGIDHYLVHGLAWQRASAWVSLVGAPAVAGAYIFLRRPLERALRPFP
jgi:patatin-related protein